jgi:dienelactone hydrolase
MISEGIALLALRPASIPVAIASDVYGSSEDNNNMTRRDLCRSVLLYATANVTSSSQVIRQLQGFAGTKFHAYSRCLPDYLSSLAHQAAERRNTALAKLNSAPAIQDRQKWARQTLWTLIGGTPDRTALKARIVGSFEREGYRVEKTIYESQPSLFVSANLYVPKRGSGPFPAVLFQSGHYWEGKAYPSYQRCCQGLVQLGFVVLAFDPTGQGERINYPDGSGTRSRLSSCDEEHTLPGKQFLLFGDSATRFQLWDAVRSLDYLLSRPEVDRKRVASVGHSGGGTLTMLLAGADERLAAAGVCMGNTENVAAVPFLSPGATDDAEQNLVNSGPQGFDRWDLLYPFAPKPLLIWPSDRDFHATYSPEYIRNGWEEYQKLKRVYETLGHSDHIAWADTPLPHALAYDSRLMVYNWFSRWLKDGAEKVQRRAPGEARGSADIMGDRIRQCGALIEKPNAFHAQQGAKGTANLNCARVFTARDAASVRYRSGKNRQRTMPQRAGGRSRNCISASCMAPGVPNHSEQHPKKRAGSTGPRRSGMRSPVVQLRSGSNPAGRQPHSMCCRCPWHRGAGAPI